MGIKEQIIMTQLTSILTNLSQGATESVQNGQTLGNLDKYLHIKRNIEDKLCAKMASLKNQSGGLILLVGSAGDGKSHLISTIRNREEYSDFYFYNDATESYSPIKTAVDTLKDVLADFSDEKIEVCTKKLVLAINIGKLKFSKSTLSTVPSDVIYSGIASMEIGLSNTAKLLFASSILSLKSCIVCGFRK